MSADPLRIGVACFSTFGGSGVIASEIGMAMARRGHHVVFFSDQPPARSTIEVARLPKDVLVEVEAIALRTKG